MKLFVLDPHTIYRRGMVACLESMPEVEAVAHEATVEDAWLRPELLEADLVILDPASGDARRFIRAVDARVLVCCADCDEAVIVSALRAGAVGALHKGALTREALGAAVTDVVNSPGVTELRGPRAEPARPSAAPLTDREQQVLSLIAAGHPTREVAERLNYSERTVKNVLHDVITKLNVRSRSQAVALAVREGLI